jgi:KTSC domain
MAIQWQPVKSSNIGAVAFDDQTGTLHVKFKGDSGVYTYAGVPKDIYAKMVSGSESVGKLLHTSVKGKYPHKKV